MQHPIPLHPWEVRGFRHWHGAMRAHQHCEQEMARFLKPLNLTPPQYELLANIACTPGITQQDLSNALAMTKSNVSTILAVLEKRGLVRRETDASDRRLRRLALTGTAEKILPDAFRKHAELVSRMMRHMSDADIEVMGRMIEGVLHSFDNSFHLGVQS